MCHILAANLFGHLWQAVFLILLLAGSAFFSGSETAFFHLPRRQVRRFAQSAVRLERLIALILSDPNRFLTALLLGNMAVNVLFFADTSMLSLQIAQSLGAAQGAVFAGVCFVMLLLCGEMLPKSLAYSNSKRFCLVASPACFVLVRLLGPVLKLMDVVVVQPAIRLFVRRQKTANVSVNQLRTLLESSRRRGLISNDENQLLGEILKFTFLKARHVMQPRVEMPACSIDTPVERLKHLMNQNNLTKIPVYTKDIDSVVGIVHLRDLFLHPDRPAGKLIHKVHFVPEQKTVESLIDFFKQTRTDMAIVVDEYGGIAGWVQLEDVIEQLLGPMEDIEESEPIEQIGPMSYRLLADLSIYEWGDAFGIDVEDQRLTTIGGFVIAMLGKIPRPGDTAVFKNMKFTVESIEQNRIRSVILSLEPLVQPDF